MLMKGDFRSLDLYSRFTGQVSRDFEKNNFIQLISDAILNFRVIAEKVFTLSSNDDFMRVQWLKFKNSQPCYAYSGDTKNKGVIASFNTPFFPDVLVSTSVLQEGVNLQYFCDEIVHYGIAWTPGDNEQRVGRIDRMFSKVERQLNQNNRSRLHIVYPFLQNTIDQDRVVNFIFKKRLEEDLIDYCRPYGGDSTLDFTQLNYDNWKYYLRSPENRSSEEVESKKDPFPPQFETLKDPGQYWVDDNETPSKSIKEILISELSNDGYDVYADLSTGDYLNSHICIADREISGRRQPVFIYLKYEKNSSSLIGEVTYILELLTPLGRKIDFEKFDENKDSFYNVYLKDYMNVKLCLDLDQRDSSYFGIYAKTELPLFPKQFKKHLSKYELLTNVNELAQCADYIENKVFANQQDLKINENISIKENQIYNVNQGYLKSKNNKRKLGNSWQINGDISYLRYKMKPKMNFKLHLEFNHVTPFLKMGFHNGKDELSASLKSKDIQNNEMELIEWLFREQKVRIQQDL